MLPSDLKPEHFSAYPPDAKRLAEENLGTIRELPLGFASGVLRELIDYDYKFPAERKALESELANLDRLPAPERREWLREFASLTLSPTLERFDWVNSPAQFVEQLSAHLWTCRGSCRRAAGPEARNHNYWPRSRFLFGAAFPQTAFPRGLLFARES